MSNSVRLHRRQPTRLCCPWNSPGKDTGVGCHFLLQCIKMKSESKVTQSRLTLRDPMDCSLPGSCAHGIFQATVLEWGAIAFSVDVYSGYIHYCQNLKATKTFFFWLKKSILQVYFFLIEIWNISHWNVKDSYCFTSWSSWFTIPKSHHFVRKEHYRPDKVIQKFQQPSSFPLMLPPPPGKNTILGQPCSRRRDTQNRPNMNLRPGDNSPPMFPWTPAVWHRSKHYTHISIWYMVYIPFLLLEPTFRQRLVYFIHDHRT